MNEDPNRVWIFDTTLRDGEQSPGATMNVDEKVVIARQLDALNVDVIEAGFAIASPGDAEAINRVAEVVAKPIVLSLARTREADIEAALKSVEKATHPGIHVFIATSDKHLERKLMMSRQEVIDAACWAVRFARQHIDYVEFSAEDASRSDPEYLRQVFAEVIACGASTVNVPDTTGYAVPRKFGALFADLIANTPGGDTVRWSAHCHNDLGMATANSLAAVENGARQIECTINGIGERAGNTAMEEVVMAIDTHGDHYKTRTGIVTEQIYPASQLLSQTIGVPVPPNKAIVGGNAFAHEAGIHQDGMLKDRETYEIMRPEKVGVPSNKLVLGKHSGRAAIFKRVKELGLWSDDISANQLYVDFTILADRQKSVSDADLIALVTGQQSAKLKKRYALEYAKIRSLTGAPAKASIALLLTEGQIGGMAYAFGVVDAVRYAIRNATGILLHVDRYLSAGISPGAEALGQAAFLFHDDSGAKVSGHGIHKDINQAIVLAFIDALNRLAAGTVDHGQKPTL